MEFVCYTDWTQLPESANFLFGEGEKDSIFFSRPWFENLASTALDEDQHMLLACVVEGENVLAILPVMKRTGTNWCALSHNYSSLYTLLLAGMDQQPILECLVQGLSRLPFQSLRLEPVDEHDDNLNRLQHVMQAFGFECHRSFRFYNWFCRVQGKSFADYMAARPAMLRNTIARKRRKLARERGYDIQLFCGDQVPQAMTDYNAIYKASWKANEQYGDIMAGLVNRFSRLGWSRLAVLYIGGKPAAAQLWFVLHGRASIFRLAYDEAWKQYSPGSILSSYLMEYVIDTEKVEEIDFLMGNEPYKQDWMSKRRERWGLICVNVHKSRSRIAQFAESLKGLLTPQN